MIDYFQGDKNEESTERLYKSAYKHHQRASQCPEAVYGALDEDKLWNKEIGSQIEACWQYVPDAWGSAKIVHIGDCGSYDRQPDPIQTKSLVLEKVVLHDKRTVNIELSGSYDLVWSPPQPEKLHILAKKTSLGSRTQAPTKHILEPFLFALIYGLQTAQADEISFAVGIPAKPNKSDKGPRWFNYSLSTDAARLYLVNLIVDYLDHTKIDLLPYSILKDMKKSEITNKAIEQAIIEAQVADDQYGQTYKPKGITAILVNDLRAPVNAQEIANRRLSIIWDQDGGQA